MVSVALLLVLAIVIIIAFLLRHRRRRRKGQQYRQAPSHDDKTSAASRDAAGGNAKALFYSQEDLKKRNTTTINAAENKRMNIPTTPDDTDRSPPPVPKRPVSYTPSVNDTVAPSGGGGGLEAASRNYGSAADDLNNMSTIAEYLAAPGCDAHAPLLDKSPPPPPRKQQQQHGKASNKRGWDPNINFPEGKYVDVYVLLYTYMYAFPVCAVRSDAFRSTCRVVD